MNMKLKNRLFVFEMYVELLAVDGLDLKRLITNKPALYCNNILNELGLTAVEVAKQLKEKPAIPFKILRLLNK